MLVEACGNASPLLQSGKAALDDIAIPVFLGIELRRSATRRSFRLSPRNLIVAFGNRMAYPSGAQSTAGRRMRVRLVGCGMDSHPGVIGTIVIQKRYEDRIITRLSGSEDEIDDVHPNVRQSMDLRRDSSPGPSQSVINWLDRRILVVQTCHLCGLWLGHQLSPCGHRRHVGGHARSWSRRRETPRSIPQCHQGSAQPGLQFGGSLRRCHRWRSGSGVSTRSARVRTLQAGHARGCQCGSASRCLRV